MEFEQILELIKTVSDSKVTSFTLEEGDKRITIKTGCTKAANIVPQVVPVVPQAVAQPQIQAVQAVPQSSPAAVAEKETTENDVQDSGKVVKSPLVGTFYSAASPDDEPFVKVGDRVTKGQVLGIIEAMKLMNEIESEYDGEVVKILVNNEGMVEYGQPLFVIK